jgi:hypothetical protein
MEQSPVDDSDDHTMFDSVIRPSPDDLDDLGLLLVQPNLTDSRGDHPIASGSGADPVSSAAATTSPSDGNNTLLGTALEKKEANGPTAVEGPAAAPVSRTGDDLTGPENTGTDHSSPAVAGRPNLPAISISAPVDGSDSEEEMDVEGSSPIPLPIRVVERQEPQ